MANRLIKALGKRKLTGAELGNLAILNTVYQIKNYTTETPVNKIELQNAVNGLTDNADIEAYNQRIQIRDFIHEVMGRKSLIEEIQKKHCLILINGLEFFSRKMKGLGLKKPLQMTYKEYEAFKEEKLHKWLFNDDGTDSEITYIFLVLPAIQRLSDTNDKMGDIINSYKGGKLTEEEEAFLKQHIRRYDYKNSPAVELIKKRKLKEYLITEIKTLLREEQTIETSEGTATLEEYKPVKADIALNLSDYIRYLIYNKNKSEDDIVKVVKEYKDIVEYAKEYADNTLFKGDIKDFSIDDLLYKNIKRKELLNKYNFDVLKGVLGTEEILITNGYNKANFFETLCRFNDIRDNASHPDLGESLQSIQYSDDLLYNIEAMLTLVADFTGLKEIKELIGDDREKYTAGFYLFFTGIFSDIDNISPTAEQEELLRETLKNIEEKITEAPAKKADEKLIKKCKKLLCSRSDFNSIKDEFYFTLLKGGEE